MRIPSSPEAIAARDREDHRIGAVRDRLLARYLGFAFGGLHLELRDMSAEIAEARRMLTEHLGREPQMPSRSGRFIFLWVVSDETNEVVGRASREVGSRGSALVVAHKRLQIQPSWRRRGFGSALLAENRAWYRDCGVESIVMEAEGDGSAFAARHRFDFDVTSYGHRPGFTGLTDREIRCAAIDRLIGHRSIPDDVDGQSQPRETVVDFLTRLSTLGADAARQVREFQQRLPRPAEPGQGSRRGDEMTFTTPEQIAAFGHEEPLEVLDGSSLGLEVLTRTGWSGISHL